MNLSALKEQVKNCTANSNELVEIIDRINSTEPTIEELRELINEFYKFADVHCPLNRNNPIEPQKFIHPIYSIINTLIDDVLKKLAENLKNKTSIEINNIAKSCLGYTYANLKATVEDGKIN